MIRLAVLPRPVLLDEMNITSKGQVTIPQRIRNQFGLKPGTEVEFVAEGHKVLLLPKRRTRSLPEDWLRQATGAVKGRTTAAAMRLTRGED